MKFSRSVLLALLPSTAFAFSVAPHTLTKTSLSFASPSQSRTSRLYASESIVDNESEIDRLKQMAAKLRAEAAALESQQADRVAEAAQKAFERFDTNQDGQITVEELKDGLEKIFKKELPERQVRKLMQNFDQSGDGALQPNEFVSLDQLRNKLDAIIRDEKANAIEAAKMAKKEEETLKFIQAQMEVLNDREPTTKDKILSVLPYLFPLMDSLAYGRFLVLENLDNPLAVALGLLYTLYRSVPFSGFIAFLSLSFFSGNPSINRLIRFNMQQAIFLDIALFFPGLIAGLYSLVASGVGFTLPAGAVVLANNALFLTLLAVIGYATVSSLLGITPDRVPFISQASNDRMPTLEMFDESGRFVPRNERDSKDKKDDADKN
ncbi:hypothetical protein MPSEU_000843100 [Mayamaea pseudoterrestris]|nr:hypothetical protein MPSEU_000843100 [Mayamaea pseudoterrestris]